MSISEKHLIPNAPNQHQIDSLKLKNDGTNPFHCNYMNENNLQGSFLIRTFV